MIKKTEAIVLKNSSYAEADLIVTFFTKEFGLIKLFAKSPKKIKSRFGSSLEPLTYSNIAFFGKENTPLPRLIQSDIIKNFQSLREDFSYFLKVNELLELCIHLLPEKVPNEEIFNLLLFTLLRLEEMCDQNICSLFYKIKFLDIFGSLPNINNCGKCGNKIIENGKNQNFSVLDGSIMCNDCAANIKDQMVEIGSSTLKFFRSILRWNHTTIKRAKVHKNLIIELTNLINLHINQVFGAKIISYK
ncbi:MAG: DNA repair protein RecO [Thermodesulfovibrionales bacterium]|nr:DNA repair protein RecO [Thermodesulfovibrionales bacterium]